MDRVLKACSDGDSILQSGRALTGAEIQQLERQGNWSTAWDQVRYAGSFNDSHEGNGQTSFCFRIRGCSFVGPVLLNDFGTSIVLPESAGLALPSGLYNSTLSMVHVGPGALIKDCSLAACMAVSHGNAPPRAAYTAHVAQIQARLAAAADFTVLDCDSSVVGCNLMSGYIGPCARVERSQMETVTILSEAQEPVHIKDASVCRTLLQPGAIINSRATVYCALIMEHAGVELHAKLKNTILAPDSHVGAGDCHHSLVGPFIGFHHQSLLISAIWPLGRGNVGYGANVGSNHTSRLADQEMWAGEGVFFGLSCTIKYPFNITEAPYSVVAAGATCLPQRVALPFSLIAPPLTAFPGAALGLNQLHPAWVLTQSMYSIVRNAAKYRSRSRALHTRVGWDIFRRSTVQLMVHARDAANGGGDTAVPKDHAYVGDAQMAGLGKNIMTEADRRKGEAAYTMHIRRYALTGLLRWLEGRIAARAAAAAGDAGANADAAAPPLQLPPPTTMLLHVSRELPQPPPTGEAQLSTIFEQALGEEDEWDFQRAVLGYEFGAAMETWEGIKGVLLELKAAAAAVAAAVAASKGRDDKRGAQVIPGYMNAHMSAADDPVVLNAKAGSADVARRVEVVRAQL
ncbi:hypothetical protein JKP88DRAFT_198541 [Tribonema minus]|uniref:Uncharacterized protein n=1 Tax=Tribonema minus TaxID=303371 RepID=A0A835Z3E2_9STRA|nr:hypothetical protein JKP88DRAFT_198541 [Tribonema minus]